MSGQGIIPKQWERFFVEGILESIPDRNGSEIVAVYTDYESDANGPYTFLLGARVKHAAQIPKAMSARQIPAGTYVVVTSATGPLHQVVPQAWSFVWSAEFTKYKRTYLTDFEIYDHRAQNPARGQVDIYVGIELPAS